MGEKDGKSSSRVSTAHRRMEAQSFELTVHRLMETLQTDPSLLNNGIRSAEAGSTPRLAPIEEPDSW